jgi:hypothetical protein
MLKKLLIFVGILSLCMSLWPAHAVPGYAPHQGDYFNYYDVINLNNGTGAYYGYSEHETVNGIERMNHVYANSTVASNYTYTWNWSNSSGSVQSGTTKGNFTWSWNSFQYVKGNDSQTGYVKPLYVWFYMDNTTQTGATFHFLNTPMNVTSTGYSYFLASQNEYVKAIAGQGNGGFYRNDVYGQYSAHYAYTTYYDPLTGYVIGYEYIEQDTGSYRGQPATFTWADALYVTATSYPLTAVAAPPSNSGSILVYILVGLLVLIAIIIIIAIIAIAVSRRRRRLPKHLSFQQAPQQYPQQPPPQINLTPKEPPVQQIVVKEIVKVKCKYCGALIDATVQACPFCGAPRT